MRSLRRAVLAAVFVSAAAAASAPARPPLPPLRPMLHAHNCYPEDGRWADRIERALGTALAPIAIEQDLVWSPVLGRSVVSHGAPLRGTEPTLEEHFFERIAPVIDGLLRENRPESWPAVVLHFDFKTNEPEHHRAVWELLGRYERWLTTAPREGDGDIVQPWKAGPLLVLTESGPGQEQAFDDAVPIGAQLRVFGAAPPVVLTSSRERQAQVAAAIAASPETLIPSRATNYRRWVNFSWLVVERGGQASAGGWSPADGVRLRSLVDRAHARGFWIRFYTLNGHSPQAALGWTAAYNFGSLDRARIRWRAAIDAGVDFVATDQYEEFARELRR